MQLNKFIRIFPLLIALLPCFAQAQDPSNKPSFSTTCEKNWMINIDNTSDDVTFRDFGQKYCDCASSQPQNIEPAKTKAICMSRVALYLTMDAIGAEEGLSHVTEDKIKSSCNTIWEIVSQSTEPSSKQKNAQICICAAPKLNALTQKKENYTDREWYTKINEIAAGC